jgi:inhibitor of cysteine peptidase
MRKLAAIFASLLILSIIIGMIGCDGGTESTPTPTPTTMPTMPTPTPTPSSTPAALNVDDSYSGGQVELSVGQLLVVTLNSNPSTGYSWSLAQNSDSSVLTEIGNEYIAPQTTLVGAGGKEEWTFKALKKGTSSISMEYRRPWETGTPPAETFSLTVVVTE